MKLAARIGEAEGSSPGVRSDTAGARVRARFVFFFAALSVFGCVLGVSQAAAQNRVPSQGTSSRTPTAPATPVHAAVTPVAGGTAFPRFLFEVNGDQTISTYAVVASTGQLRSLTYNLGGSGGSSEIVLAGLNPSGKALYTIAEAGSLQELVTYSVSTGGFLTQLASSNLASANSKAMAVDPLGRYLWLVNNATSPAQIVVFPLDSVTGAPGTQATAFTLSSLIPLEVMLADPSGSYFFTEDQDGNITAYTIGAGGVLAALGTPPTSHPFANGSLVVDPSSKFLYAMDSSSLDAIFSYSISPTAGLSAINGSPFAVSNSHELDGQMVINPAGTFLYAVDISNPNDPVDIFSIGATGALTQVAQTVPQPSFSPGALTINMDPSGSFLYVGFDEAHEIWTYSIAQSGSTAGQLTLADRVRMRLSRPTAQLLSAGPTPLTFTSQALYVTNLLSSDVAEFSISSTGTLTSVGTVAAGTNPLGIAVTPNGEFAYVADSTESPGTVSAYSVSTDTLTSLGPVVNTGAYPNGLATDLSGSFLYTANAANPDIWGFQIGATGTISGGTEAGSTGTNSAPLFVATDPTGLYLYSANSGTGTVGAFSIQLPSGTLMSVGAPVSAGGPTTGGVNGTNSVAIDPTGRFLYATAPVTNTVAEYSVAASTGGLTAITNPFALAGPSNATPGASSVVVEPTGRFAYVTNQSLNQIFGYTIDPTTGLLSDLLTGNPDNQVANTGTTPMALAVDPSGKFLFCVNSGSSDIDVYTINADGTLTMVGTTTVPSGGSTPEALVVTGTVSVATGTAVTTTTVTSSQNPSAFGQSVTLTATVSPESGSGTPTGTVNFADGGNSIGTGTLSGGVATLVIFTLAVGDHTISASYSGDSNFASSTGQLSGNPQVVTQASTSTALTASPNPATAGQSATLTATVSVNAPGSGTPNGTVTFANNGTPLTCTGGNQTLTANQATCQLTFGAAGSYPLSAMYNGSSNFASSSGATTLTVVVPTSTLVSIAISPSTATAAQGETQQFTAMGTFSDGSVIDLTSQVTWTASPTTIATISNNTGSQGLATAVSSGAATITATQGAISGTATLNVPIAVNEAVTMSDEVFVTTVVPVANPVAEYSFSTMYFGSQSTQMLAISNLGQSNLTFSASTISGSGFSMGPISCSTGATSLTAAPLAPGAVCYITITYALGGAPTGTIIFTDNTPSSNIASVQVGAGRYTQTINLSASTGTNVVPPAALVALAVTPANPTVAEGSTQQFAAMGTLSNGSASDMTTQAAWSASPTTSVTVATISNANGSQGLASVIAPGSAIITATVGLLSASTNLNAPIPDAEAISVQDTVTLQVSGGTVSGTTTTIKYTASSLSGVSLPANTSLVGNPVTVNFAVAPNSGVGTPTGTVTVSDNAGDTCKSSLTGGAGSCQLTIAQLGSGTSSVTAAYVPDANSSALFSGSTSTALTEKVVQIVACGNSVPPQTVAQGGTVIVKLDVCIASDVQAVPTSLVSNCPANATCTATVAPSPGQPGVYVVTVKIVTTDSGGRAPVPVPVLPHGYRPVAWPLAWFAVLLAFLFLRRRSPRPRVLYAGAFLLAVTLGGFSGCTSASLTNQPPPTGTPVGNFTVNATITAGNATVSVPIQLIVTK